MIISIIIPKTYNIILTIYILYRYNILYTIYGIVLFYLEGIYVYYYTKRDGRTVPYNIEKISNAIRKAMEAAGRKDPEESVRLADLVEKGL